ncbi:MAG: hypothetical protein Tsb0027_02120 [Wenzhouxiangellaceae bacterium]
MKKQIFAMSMLAVAGFAGSSHAVDGVFELNEACASIGCVTGDTSGFPITITNPGSYRLTSNLATGSAATTLIEVTASNVSIDLNGFSLIGPVSCSGSELTCTTSGAGIGIDALGQENIVIRNGSIAGMGNDGLQVGVGALLEDLVVAENGNIGINAQSAGAVLQRLAVRENGGIGVALGFGSSYLMDSTVFNNADQGVFGGFCGNVLMVGNRNGGGIGNSCIAIAPNRCDVATECD